MTTRLITHITLMALLSLAGCQTQNSAKIDSDDDHQIYSDYVCTYCLSDEVAVAAMAQALGDCNIDYSGGGSALFSLRVKPGMREKALECLSSRSDIYLYYRPGNKNTQLLHLSSVPDLGMRRYTAE